MKGSRRIKQIKWEQLHKQEGIQHTKEKKKRVLQGKNGEAK